MLEDLIVRHCAPTLTGLKLGSLFLYREFGLEREIRLWNKNLNKKGIFVEILREDERGALIYVYRRKQLAHLLENQRVNGMLAKYGYSCEEPDEVLRVLGKRLKKKRGFPHEIGIFLGYPLEDVVGFIQNGGKNYMFCGCWKVYCNEQLARRQFERLIKCKRICNRLYEEGQSIMRLAVAVSNEKY